MSAWKIKNLHVLNLHPKLIELAEWVKEQYGYDFITSAYRFYDQGVHGHYRGLDLRVPPEKGEHLAYCINTWWEYDKERSEMRCAIYHDVGSGPHLHLQVHPNTRKRSLDTNGRYPV